MDRNLFLAIEPAEVAHDEACTISDAICELSRHYSATATLLAEYKRLILETELQWQKVETRPDYHYQSRDDARADFLKLYWKGEKP